MSVPNFLLRRSLLVAATAAPAIARAQNSLPDRSLRIVVGFAAGGGSDVMARAIAATLEQRIGRRVVIENRPGGTGTGAGEALKHSPPDGTTVAFMPTSSLIAKLFLASYPFDPLTDLAPITTVGTFIQALAVSPRIGVSTIPEYVTWLKSDEPDRRRIGATATDVAMVLYSRLLSRAFGVPMEGVSFRGSAAMVNDLAEGKVPAAVGALTSLLVASRGGRVRLLAVSGTKRAAVATRRTDGGRGGFLRAESRRVVWFFCAGRYASAIDRGLEHGADGRTGLLRTRRSTLAGRPGCRDIDTETGWRTAGGSSPKVAVSDRSARPQAQQLTVLEKGVSMFSHVTIGSNDMGKAKPFYDALLQPLGLVRHMDYPNAVGYGPEGGRPQLWILTPLDKQAATVGNGITIGLEAPDRSAVDAAHRAALAAGGVDEGAPGIRAHYHPNYYGGYLRDPDGNKICVVCHRKP